MSEPIKCIFINVNSLVSRHRRHYLQLFLNRHKPHILLLAEHKLNSHHKLNFEGYLMYRQDRINSGGGGTAVLIRDTLRCERIVLDTGDMESTAVRIHRSNGTSVTVISLYSRPCTGLGDTDFSSILELSSRSDVLIGGDLNAKHPHWGGTVTNTNGRSLYDILLGCPDLDTCCTDGPTRVSRTAESYIDIFVASPGLLDGSAHRNMARVLDFESDHNAIEVLLNRGGLAERDPATMYDFDKIDGRKLNLVLSRNIADHCLPLDRNVTRGEIDHCVGIVGESFRVAMDEAIPKRREFKRGLPPLPPFILNFIREKKRLRRILHRTLNFERYGVLRAQIANLDNIIQGAIAEFERDHWAGYLQRIRVDNKTFRKVKGAAGLLTRDAIPHLTNGDTIATDDAMKADLLAEKFFHAHNGNHDLLDDALVARIADETVELGDSAPQLAFGSDVRADGTSSGGYVPWLVRPEQIGMTLKHRPNKRSCGLDGIPDIVLRRTTSAIWTILAVIFNHCINLGYFPNLWKRALVVPIRKAGADPRLCDGYRPISLLSPLGKLLETFIMSPIRDKLFNDGLLLPNQFGFIRGHSTSHALTVLSDYVARGLNKRHVTIAASLDFAKAFDTAWHDGILHKLMAMGFDSYICRMVCSFLKGRTFSVRVGDAQSSGRLVPAGVPQGSILGPILYNVYVSDIPRPADGDLLLIYADDTLVASSGARAGNVNRRLNEYLAALFGFFTKWGIRLNVAKTKGIIFKGKRKFLYPNSRQFVPTLSVGGSSIAITDEMKYLGVIFSGKFEFCRHVDHMLCKVKRAFAMYIGLLHNRGGLDPSVKLLIYKQIIRPLLSYAFPAWFNISSHQMERIRVWERRILSSCLGLRSEFGADGIPRRPSCAHIYSLIDFERIDVFLIKSALTFFERSADLENELFQQSCNIADDSEILSENYLPPVGLLSLEKRGLLFDNDRLLFYHRRFNTYDLLNTVYNTNQ